MSRQRIDVFEEPLSALRDYAQIPISFLVNRILDVSSDAGGRIVLANGPVEVPYVKDYDAIHSEGPLAWPKQFDLSKWALFAARIQGERVGSAAVAHDAVGLDLSEGRTDLAVLWDIRVVTHLRGMGVGSALFRAAEEWALAKGCSQLKIETQNINVDACNFYARQGCVLGAAHRHVYPAFPNEIQLFWYKDLVRCAADQKPTTLMR